MKRITCILLMVLLMALSGCSAIKQKTLEELREDYANNPNDIDTAAQLIDILLLEDQKEEAYDVLLSMKEVAETPEQYEKLKANIESMPIRLVEVDTYENGKMTDMAYYRYDENGRILSDGDVTYFYPDDGGNVYCYTLSSWYDNKVSYDKEGNVLASYDGSANNTFDDEGNLIKSVGKGTFPEGTYETNYSYKNGKLSKTTSTFNYTGGGKSYSVNEYIYDENGDLVKESIDETEIWSSWSSSYKSVHDYEYVNHQITHEKSTYSYSSGSYSSNDIYDKTYEYDSHGNVTKTTNSYRDYQGKQVTEITEYQYEYDENDNIVKKVTTYTGNNSWTRLEVYEYDSIYGVLASETMTDSFSNYAYVKEYIYELISPDSKHIGLISEDAVTFVSGNATKAIIKREITATSIKVRTAPTVGDDNRVGTVKKGEVVNVYDSVYNEGYAWHQIGVDQWIADDGTWTRVVN